MNENKFNTKAASIARKELAALKESKKLNYENGNRMSEDEPKRNCE